MAPIRQRVTGSWQKLGAAPAQPARAVSPTKEKRTARAAIRSAATYCCPTYCCNPALHAAPRCALQGSGAERRAEELRTALAQEQLLLGKAEGALGVLRAAGAGAGAPALLALGADALAEALDRRLGATVTDPAIFRAHAAKYEAEFLEDLAALGCRQPDVLTRVRCGGERVGRVGLVGWGMQEKWEQVKRGMFGEGRETVGRAGWGNLGESRGLTVRPESSRAALCRPAAAHCAALLPGLVTWRRFWQDGHGGRLCCAVFMLHSAALQRVHDRDRGLCGEDCG
jgi:hypothetical protein